MPTLTIQLPGLPSVEHIVREDAITLGRMKGNSIALNDSSVSLSHAKITRAGNDFFLKDLNSTNGTMLNGQSITEARLRDGDQVKLGEVIAYFRVEPLSAPGASVTASAELVPALKPVAQSVVTPPAPPSIVLPVNPSSVSTPRPAVPPKPLAVPRRSSSRMPLLIGCSVVGLTVIGVIVWKFFSGNSMPATSVLPPTVAVTKPASAPAAKSAPAQTSPSDPTLAGLVKDLKSPDAAMRRHAAASIYNLGPGAKEALPFLPAALKDADPDVRMWVALAMVHNNVFDKACIPILIQTLHNENPTLRQVACLSLAMIPYTGAEKDPVVAALVDTASKDESAEVSNDAMTALKIVAPELLPNK